MSQLKEQKQSTTDPESGWFHKGEHKEVFAYSIQTACDINGWIIDYSVHPGNEHDSKTFNTLYEKLKKLNIKTMVMDAGYKNPAIAKLLIDDGKTITRHIWEDYIETCEDIRHTRGMKELYGKRKETIERNFGTAKEHHAMRYTQQIGKAKMSMKVGLTFACMNMKKLVRILSRKDSTLTDTSIFKRLLQYLRNIVTKPIPIMN